MLVRRVSYGARRREIGLEVVMEGRFMGEPIYLLLRFFFFWVDGPALRRANAKSTP
jgi:hypothetical protein